MAVVFTLLISFLSFLQLASRAYAVALTTSIAANDRVCFYADVDKAGEKIGVSIFRLLVHYLLGLMWPFVRLVLLCSMFTRRYLPRKPALMTNYPAQVQSGGSFDIDFEVREPTGKSLLDGQRERQGDYVFTANVVGEYQFCFENDMSTLTEKLVDFDIMVESEPRREPSTKPGQISEQTSALEESMFRLNTMLLNVKRTQK